MSMATTKARRAIKAWIFADEVQQQRIRDPMEITKSQRLARNSLSASG
jgi:hypothetical protein